MRNIRIENNLVVNPLSAGIEVEHATEVVITGAGSVMRLCYIFYMLRLFLY